MKYILSVSICLVFVYCSSRKKVEYNIPADVGSANREILIQRFEKGKVLYKIHCSNCHGIYSKGKDSITNFTSQQIDNYTTVALANPQNHTVMKRISPEQFDYIITFLRLRKTSNQMGK